MTATLTRERREELIGLVVEAETESAGIVGLTLTREEHRDLLTALRRLGELETMINTPHIAEFLESVKLEAVHQRERWGTEHDACKTDADWFWLVGYLCGKAIRPDITHENHLHHIITTAAALLNWHAAKTVATEGAAP